MRQSAGHFVKIYGWGEKNYLGREFCFWFCFAEPQFERNCWFKWVSHCLWFDYWAFAFLNLILKVKKGPNWILWLGPFSISSFIFVALEKASFQLLESELANRSLQCEKPKLLRVNKFANVNLPTLGPVLCNWSIQMFIFCWSFSCFTLCYFYLTRKENCSDFVPVSDFISLWSFVNEIW